MVGNNTYRKRTFEKRRDYYLPQKMFESAEIVTERLFDTIYEVDLMKEISWIRRSQLYKKLLLFFRVFAEKSYAH